MNADIRPDGGARADQAGIQPRQFKFDLDRRPDPNRPFTYAVYDQDPVNRAINQQLLFPTISRDDAGKIVLDLGCSTGGNTQMLADAYEKNIISVAIIGMDINQQSLQHAIKTVKDNEYVGVTFEFGDATNLPLYDSYIGKAYFTGILHELQGTMMVTDQNGDEQVVEKKDRALQELYRVMEPGAELLMISAFTKELFNFDFIDTADDRRTSKTEFTRHGRAREAAMLKLGKAKDRTKPPFEVLSTEQMAKKLQQAGFLIYETTDITTERADLTIDSMRAIAEDEMYIQGIFQDMLDTESIDLPTKREAYQQVLDEMEAKHATNWQQTHPGEAIPPLLFPRNFVLFKARKPLNQAA